MSIDDIIDGLTDVLVHYPEIKGFQEKAINYAILKLASQKWIPVTERLPEDYQEVLCWYEYFRHGDCNRLDQDYEIGYYVTQYERWFMVDGNGSRDRVLAWQPLPEPYREDSK